MTSSQAVALLHSLPTAELATKVRSWGWRARLNVKLTVVSAVLTAAVVSSAFLALSFELRANMKRLFAEELNRNQRTLLNLQNRTLRELHWTLSLVTESPTLRAAMETYRVESDASGPRAQLLSTIQLEVEKIVGSLGKDLLVVTDHRGRVLAASERHGARPAIDADLSAVPTVGRSLDPSVEVDEPNFAVVRFNDQHFQLASVPIVLGGFIIGTASLGERLDQTFVQRLQESFDGEVLLVTGAAPISSTLPALLVDSAAVAALASRTAASGKRTETLRLAREDFVTTALPLGLNEAGQPVVLYLLHSLTLALNQPNHTLLLAFLLYGSLAVVLVGVGAGALSRSVLQPLKNFVGFMRSVADTSDYSSRFDSSKAALEVQTLNDSYNHLIESLAQKHAQLEHRTAELSLANEDLTETIAEREQAERALLESEEQLRQSQKLESLGTLAGGVAHDFNNLLTVITGYTQLLAGQVDAANPMREDLEQIKQAAHRAATLTSQLLAFSRRQVLQPKVIDLNSVVIGVEAMLRRLIGEDIELRTVKRTALSRIKADPGQIEQVIMNLAVNARDAMPSGGKLTIETADVRLDERRASQHDSVSPGQWVMLSVSDSGIGMDEATRARIFEPFFTTKPLGKGTGLGLSTVYGIVKQSGGSVWVDSKLGHGTTFKIYLPPVEGIAELAAAEPQHAPIGSETILLVEDEDGVRALAQKCLERSGYQVLTARHGLEALDVAEGHANPIHLLLTDIVMPHMGGRKLAERLAPQRREMQVLFTSGYTDDAIVHHGVLEPGTELLQKPFTPDALLRRVRAVLDAARERA